VWTFNRRRLYGPGLERAIQDQILAQVRAQLRERLRAICLPSTGEFPTFRIEGDTLRDLWASVESSPELIEHIKSRLSPEEQAGLNFTPRVTVISPRMFLSYGWEDRVLAKTIAETFVANGLQTWWAEWEINYGDSLRQKIDAGLGDCTHFIVLVTATSITKAWVNQEMDAGLIRKIEDKRIFIPLRHNLPVSQLPPLIRGLLSPEVNDDASNLGPLIQQIYGAHRRPALGSPPLIARMPVTGYTAAATAIARVFVKAAGNATTGEVQYSAAELANETGLSEEDVCDALHELNSFFIAASGQYLAKASLYASFDRAFMEFDPAVDALQLAADLVNDPTFPGEPKIIAERLKWTPRRLNPAITYLRERDLIGVRDTLGSAPFEVTRVNPTAETRRFIKSRS
jgi:hypothetical protein